MSGWIARGMTHAYAGVAGEFGLIGRAHPGALKKRGDSDHLVHSRAHP